MMGKPQDGRRIPVCVCLSVCQFPPPLPRSLASSSSSSPLPSPLFPLPLKPNRANISETASVNFTRRGGGRREGLSARISGTSVSTQNRRATVIKREAEGRAFWYSYGLRAIYHYSSQRDKPIRPKLLGCHQDIWENAYL